MNGVAVREMGTHDEWFISTCSHVDESQEINVCARERRLFARLRSNGAVLKVAVLGCEPVGFAYGIPIEHSPWGPIGEALIVIPCLYVLTPFASHGVGRALGIKAVEADARAAGLRGVTTITYRGAKDTDGFLARELLRAAGIRINQLTGNGTPALESVSPMPSLHDSLSLATSTIRFRVSSPSISTEMPSA